MKAQLKLAPEKNAPIAEVAINVRAKKVPKKSLPIKIDAEGKRLRLEIVSAQRVFMKAVKSNNKNKIRKAHILAKLNSSPPPMKTLNRDLKEVGHLFINGKKVDPNLIDPSLILVEPDHWTDRAFRLARISWSLPYNKGYGRRLRFIVFDKHHEAVIGIIGLQSAPADLKCRDMIIGQSDDKMRWVNTTMDAFTVGAVEPYRSLLGGKLVAGMLCTDEVRRAYWAAYAGKISLMNKTRSQQPLLAITTTSAFGRSSIYNRLRFEDRTLAEPIGYTKGFGTIHLEELYPRIASWLESRGELIPNGFGNGPKVRWQNIQTAICRLGLPSKLMAHGLCREVYLFPLVSNFAEAAKGNELPDPIALSVKSWSTYWKERYCIPRAERKKEYKLRSGSASICNAIDQIDRLEM